MARRSSSLLSLLSLLSLISLLPFSSAPAPPTSQTLINAVEILSNSGFLSMALTLQLTSPSLLPPSPSLSFTIFSPSDAAFSSVGQPSLLLLRYHFSPLSLSPSHLLSLPLSSQIPTLAPDLSLSVTSNSSDGQISLNSIKINTSAAIYDDGSLIIYPVDRFFEIPHNRRCLSPNPHAPGVNSFARASDLLRSKGYSAAAAFLDSQLLDGRDQALAVTVFAPTDGTLQHNWKDFAEGLKILKKHVVPCRLTWADLVKVEDGTELRTFSEGFTINVTVSGDVFMLNGVEVAFPDMYSADLIVVHGLREVPAPASAGVSYQTPLQPAD